jgi:Cytochrome b5-like Heme/Steroid binding domain
MRIFRDIGRHKAYKRRYGSNEYALSTFLLQKEDPLLGLGDEREDDLPTYTVDELWEMGNVDDFQDAEDDEPRKLLLSIFGRIYDVTKGTKFYGPDSSYSMFCGRDVTYALSTGCKTDQCLAGKVGDLTKKQLDEGKRWLSFFQLHDKYPLVGKMENNPMEAMMNTWIDEIVANKDKKGAGDMPPLNF